ncbi:SulP family inorganic anion transporter [Desulfosporosinus nitroreducens]|uniref:SulP family inorganic anion transporter n=1 Tax=Desulfosporosinus nitroreducens TaxID=2018668 RepID=A0ABT8QR78_9FIRM|nr:SulP family inorganic anion transporter [Desulfosporosinus nitroreducens]MDO0823856.1 SulP family inorganic anion transporter [Desulfosporosinus nitroreducens]
METLSFRESWLSNIKNDVLAGLVVSLALIPEAIAFSIIAGVDPMVGLYSSFIIPIVIAFVGGRPGMISAATGAMALLFITLVKEHGIEYLFAATILTGIFQILFGTFKLARYMKFIPRSVMVGFVNALAIMIFTSQFPYLFGQSWPAYVMTVGALVIIYGLPLIIRSIPSTLVAIVGITAIAIILDLKVPVIGDMGIITRSLPSFSIPNLPITLETLLIIAPYSFALAMVGLTESLLTATIVDDMTDTGSNKNKESQGQGISNIVAGFLGGMAGCAMIGQSVINVKSGGRGRLSTFIAGAFLIVLIIGLRDYVVQIPMAALVAVMIMVSIGTFDWQSLKTLRITPKSDAFVMIFTVLTVLVTHNLALGVMAGVILSAVFFASKISKVYAKKQIEQDGVVKTYKISGQLFFVSVTDLLNVFDFTNDNKDNIQEVDINFSNANLWDDSAVAAIDKIVFKYRQYDIKVTLSGLNEQSARLIEKLATHTDLNSGLPKH